MPLDQAAIGEGSDRGKHAVRKTVGAKASMGLEPHAAFGNCPGASQDVGATTVTGRTLT